TQETTGWVRKLRKGQDATDDQFPGPHMGKIECGCRLGSDVVFSRADRSGGEQEQGRSEEFRCQFPQEKSYQREGDVALFLNAERPVVQQRLSVSGRAKIIG